MISISNKSPSIIQPSISALSAYVYSPSLRFWISNDVPSITTGLKGLSYLEVEVTGPNRDLHSGLYGGAVANPINILCEKNEKMKDDNNHITISGFYDNVIELSSDERADIARSPFSLDAYKKALDRNDGKSTILVEYGDYYNEK